MMETSPPPMPPTQTQPDPRRCSAKRPASDSASSSCSPAKPPRRAAAAPSGGCARGCLLWRAAAAMLLSAPSRLQGLYERHKGLQQPRLRGAPLRTPPHPDPLINRISGSHRPRRHRLHRHCRHRSRICWPTNWTAACTSCCPKSNR